MTYFDKAKALVTWATMRARFDTADDHIRCVAENSKSQAHVLTELKKALIRDNEMLTFLWQWRN